MAERENYFVFLLIVVLTQLKFMQGEFRRCWKSKSLGMQSGEIPDRNIVATTRSFNNDREMFGAHQARLNSTSGYRADPFAVKQTLFHFIEVKLSQEMIITGIATKGLGKEWLTKYKLMSGQNGTGYTRFKDVNDSILEKEFEGNWDGNSTKFNTVPFPVKTSRILVIPTQWHGNIALRFELYGCEPADCTKPLGMESGEIPDDNIVATTNIFGNDQEKYGAQRARLRLLSGYRADLSADKERRFHFIKIKLPKETIITGIATQGFEKEWVTKYTMMASQDNRFVSFRDVDNANPEKEFEGNSDGVNIKFNAVPYPLKTSEVMVVPKQWHKNIALRLELYGCEPGYYFRVWLAVLNTDFTLSYMNRDEHNTKDIEDEVLYEVNEYLKNVPGFLSVELYQFSPPFVETNYGQPAMTAEVTVFCIESATSMILTQLQSKLSNQGDRLIFGNNIQVQYLVTNKCQPPSVTISLGKDPWNAKQVIVNKEGRLTRFTVATSVQPGCPPEETRNILYNLEYASVDKKTGTFTEILQISNPNSKPNISLPLRLLSPAGLQYIRCLARSTIRSSAYRYDFGFIETVLMSPLHCEITPSQGRAILDTFTLRCTGAEYQDNEDNKAIDYTVTLDSSGGPVVIPNWRAPTDTIRLPVGNPVDDYTVRLKVEASFLSFPSLYDYVVVKVNNDVEPKQAVSIIEGLIKAERYEESSFNMWILQEILKDIKLSQEQRTKIKTRIMRGIVKQEIRSSQQLKHMIACVLFSNVNKSETSQEIQENTLRFLDKALNFLYERHEKGESISNISSITKDLLKGVSLVLGMASEDAAHSPVPQTSMQDTEKAKSITRKAVEAIHNVCRFLRKILNETDIRIDAGEVSLSLAKVNLSSVGEQVFRIKSDEVRLPGELKEALQNGAVQIIRMKNNPYSWASGTITRNVSVTDTTLWSHDGTNLKVSNLTSPVRLVFSKEPRNVTDHDVQEESFFLKRKKMRYHSVRIPSYEATVTVRIKPKMNITLLVYVRNGLRPTDKEYDLNLTLPNVNFPSCSNVTKGEHNCSSRDPYEFDLLPNATGRIGRHFIGISIHEDSLNVTGMASVIKNRSDKSEVVLEGDMEELCVKEKPPPATPTPAGQAIPRQFDSKTDVNYTFYVTVGSCVFWDTVNETWSAHGCQVARESNETRVHCLTSHLTSFAGQFYVAPNKIDFDDVFNKISSLPRENMFVLFTVCLMFACYAVGLVFARKADNRDKMKIINSKGTSYDQEQADGYSYEVSIQSGMWYGNGTTARVGIKLYGVNGKSDAIFFMDPWKDVKLFTRGSVNTFTFNLPVHLGELYKIQIWHDNSGKSPSWFLYQVVVTDMYANEKRHFVANRWLAVERLDGAIDVEVEVTSEGELTRFKSLFQWRAVTNFADRHLFLSVFTRPPQNPFTRCQRLTCMLSIIMVSLVTNAMFYRSEKGNDRNSFQLGPLEFSLRQIVVGVQSGLISLPVSIVTVMMFRNTKRRLPPGNVKDSDSSDTRGNSTEGFLPPCFIVIGWVICLTASISSGLFTVLFSVEWGAEVSNRWLLSVGLSVLQDIIIITPIIIIVSTSIASLVNRKPTENDAIEIAQQEKLIFHEDEEIKIQQPTDEELVKMRSDGIQRRKMYHFFVKLVVYFIFVVLLMTVCYANRKPSTYHLTKALKDSFSGFYQVENAKSFWIWFEEELVPGLYDAPSYNESEHSSDNEAGLTRSNIGFTVGMPRIRQIRIKQESTCRVFQAEPLLHTHIKRCLSDLSDANKDTTPFYKPGWMPLNDSTGGQNAGHGYKFCPEPWRYTEPVSVNKHLLPYDGGGYVAKLGYDASTALKVKKSIERNHWIDDKSVVVLVEFVVFEPANLLLSNVMIVFEKYATGLRRKKIVVVPEYIFPSSGSKLREFHRLCILLWAIIILVLVILEIVKVFKQGCAYFKKFFNWISFLQLSSSSCAMLMVLLKENGLRDFLQRIRDDPFGYWNAYDLVKWASIEEVILSITVVFTTIKCFKIIQFNRYIHVMKWTLGAACRYLCSFSIIVLILALGFAQLGKLLFGSKDEEYATLYKSLSTVLQMAIGVGKLRSKLGGGSESQFFAPIFLMACMLSMTIIFTDTFIAILDEAYHQASDREHPGEELGAYMRQRLKDKLKRSDQKPAFKRSFQRTIRRKTSSKRTVYSRNVNTTVERTERAKLAETESLLSYEISFADVDIHTTQEKEDTRRNIEDVGFDISRGIQPRNKATAVKQTKEARLAETEDILSPVGLREEDDDHIETIDIRDTDRTVNVVRRKTSDAVYDESIKDGFPSADESCLQSLPTEEDLLLLDVEEAMENARSELAKYLLENGEKYATSSSSFRTSNESFDEWDGSTSMLSLLDYCQSFESNNQASRRLSAKPESNQGQLTLSVLNHHGHTYIDALTESNV